MNKNNETRTPAALETLEIGDRFTFAGGLTVMTVTGKGTMGNLTRVSYLTESGPEYTFTKVNLTSVYVLR